MDLLQNGLTSDLSDKKQENFGKEHANLVKLLVLIVKYFKERKL